MVRRVVVGLRRSIPYFKTKKSSSLCICAICTDNDRGYTSVMGKKQVKEVVKKKIGRPTRITPEIITSILEDIYKDVGSESDILEKHTINWSNWFDFKDRAPQEFQDRYMRAKQSQLERWEEKILRQCNDRSRDILIDAKGVPRSDNSAVNRDRLIVDSMKWIMSKKFPAKYGDKLESLQVAAVEGNVTINILNSNSSKPPSKAKAIDVLPTKEDTKDT